MEADNDVQWTLGSDVKWLHCSSFHKSHLFLISANLTVQMSTLIYCL